MNINAMVVRFVNQYNTSKISLSTVSSYDQDTHILQTKCRYELIRHDKLLQTEIEKIQVRLYEMDEIDSWLLEAGFHITARYGDYARHPLLAADHMIIYECVK